MDDSDNQGRIIVVLTALGEEYAAMRGHLTNLREHAHPKGTLFEVGHLPGTEWDVALVELGEGNKTAAALAERATAMFQPAALLLSGVAGALKDGIPLGSVVVASRVHSYHGGKEEDAEFLARPRSWDASHLLLERAKSVGRNETWMDQPPRVYVKPIVAGEVVLNSRTSPTAQLLRKHYNDAVAVEMESGGVALAGHLNGALPVLIVRGISDLTDGNKQAADASGSQRIAAKNAAAFVVALIRELPADLVRPTRATPGPEPAGPGRPIYVSSRPDFPPLVTDWQAGQEIAVGERRYLLLQPQLTEYTSPDQAVRYQRAQVSRLDSGDEYGWLRQADSFAREHELLERLRSVRGIPRISQYVTDPDRSTLVLRWPASRRTSTPCEGLDTLLAAPGTALDRWLLRRLFSGLSGLCETLAKLHELGAAHRSLAPEAIVVLDDGSLALRDLGLVDSEPRWGEGPAAYRAPEQRSRTRGRIGPRTDVYQLAAVAYHLVAGYPPHPETPLPLSTTQVPDVPEATSQLVLQALDRDIDARPGIQRLGLSFRRAASALS